MEIKERDEFRLVTGKTFYANHHIVGIGPKDGWVHEGYDGQVDTRNWSEVERRELAEYMIGLWRKFGGIEERYWEGRWRDEAAINEKLKARIIELEALKNAQ